MGMTDEAYVMGMSTSRHDHLTSNSKPDTGFATPDCAGLRAG